jgi:hypothetical protein
MLEMGFVPAFPAFERAKTFLALDGAATLIGSVGGYVNQAFLYSLFFLLDPFLPCGEYRSLIFRVDIESRCIG